MNSRPCQRQTSAPTREEEMTMSDTYVVVGTIGRYQVVKNPISQDEITIACDPESFDKRFGVRSDADGFTVEIEPSLTYADACRLAASMEIARAVRM